MLLIAFINVIIYKISIVCAEMSLIFCKTDASYWCQYHSVSIRSAAINQVDKCKSSDGPRINSE